MLCAGYRPISHEDVTRFATGSARIGMEDRFGRHGELLDPGSTNPKHKGLQDAGEGTGAPA
jgi:hypothetical protein